MSELQLQRSGGCDAVSLEGGAERGVPSGARSARPSIWVSRLEPGSFNVPRMHTVMIELRERRTASEASVRGGRVRLFACSLAMHAEHGQVPGRRVGDHTRPHVEMTKEDRVYRVEFMTF